ncbi:MAG: hypothetical protein LBR89_03595 [Holosporales bacterium]|jgi:hypothetical protein|nr:hypothetical protein [Holosporales bacterium]
MSKGIAIIGIFCMAGISSEFESELHWQGHQLPLVNKYVHQQQLDSMDVLLRLVLNTKKPCELVRMGMLSCLWKQDLVLTQLEVDTLLSKSDERFVENVVAYIAGILIGWQILSKYNALNNASTLCNKPVPARDNSIKHPDALYRKSAIVQNNATATGQNNATAIAPNNGIQKLDADALCSRSVIASLCAQLSTNIEQDQSKYLSAIIQTITSKKTIGSIKSLISSPNTAAVAKSFEMAVSSEFALAWLDFYVKSDEERRRFEFKLMALTPETLILAGQRSLNGEDAYPKALAAYTLAATKGARDESGLDELVKFLVEHKQAQAFEPFVDSIDGAGQASG